LILGLLTGLPWPATGAAMQPRGTAFVSAVKMVVIPLVFGVIYPRFVIMEGWRGRIAQNRCLYASVGRRLH